MAIRTAHVEWTGDFKAGQGTIKPGSGTFEAGYSYDSIFRDEPGTNPMEILGASLAGCYCGALAATLAKEGHVPNRICVDSEVHLNSIEKGFTVARMHIHAQAAVPGIDEATFVAFAELAKNRCPVALALGTIEITLQADLV